MSPEGCKPEGFTLQTPVGNIRFAQLPCSKMSPEGFEPPLTGPRPVARIQVML